MPDESPDQVVVNEQVSVPLSELRFTFSRSSGPGGQNVNKVSTRVTLLFDLSASDSLTASQLSRVRRELSTRIDRQGILRVVSSRHRTQAANRQAAVERFAGLLADALAVRKERRSTRAPRSAGVRRLENKARRGKVKRLRRTRPTADD